MLALNICLLTPRQLSLLYHVQVKSSTTQILNLAQIGTVSSSLISFQACKFHTKFPSVSNSILFWSDSQIVLYWIITTKKLQSFVSNHVEQITTLFPSTSADLLTRGITSQQFISSNLWKYGPEWLALAQQWPVWPSTDIQAATVATEEVHSTVSPSKSLVYVI